MDLLQVPIHQTLNKVNCLFIVFTYYSTFQVIDGSKHTKLNNQIRQRKLQIPPVSRNLLLRLFTGSSTTGHNNTLREHVR